MRLPNTSTTDEAPKDRGPSGFSGYRLGAPIALLHGDKFEKFTDGRRDNEYTPRRSVPALRGH